MSKNKKILPELRFPEFDKDGEWENTALKKVANRITDKVGEQKLTTVSISAGIGFVSQAEKFSRDISGQQYKNYIHLKQGEFAFNKGNSKKFPQGCIYKLKEFKEAAAPNAFLCFRFKKGYIPDFYQGYFDNNYHGRQLRKFITSGARMDGLLNISPVDFFNIQLPTPKNTKEQQKIASCLSSLDELLAAHNEKLEALKDHKKGLMQNLFPQMSETRITADEKMTQMEGSSKQKISGIPKSEKIGDSDNVPKYRFKKFENDGEWVEKTIGSIAKVTAGGTPSSTEVKYWGGDIPWMNSGDLNLKRVYSVSNRITKLGLKESSTKKIPPLCILIGLAGQGKTRGTAAINYIELCTNQSIASIHPNSEEFLSEFLYQLIDSKYLELRSLSKGEGGRGGLNLQIIKSIEILLPSIKEQQKIASNLSALDELITAQSEKIEQFQLHKKGLMQGLFPKIAE